MSHPLCSVGCMRAWTSHTRLSPFLKSVNQSNQSNQSISKPRPANRPRDQRPPQPRREKKKGLHPFSSIRSGPLATPSRTAKIIDSATDFELAKKSSADATNILHSISKVDNLTTLLHSKRHPPQPTTPSCAYRARIPQLAMEPLESEQSAFDAVSVHTSRIQRVRNL